MHDTGLVISKFQRDTIPADSRRFIFPNISAKHATKYTIELHQK